MLKIAWRQSDQNCAIARLIPTNEAWHWELLLETGQIAFCLLDYLGGRA
jgi:hypothetical protein